MEKELIEELLSNFDIGDGAFIVIPIKSKSYVTNTQPATAEVKEPKVEIKKPTPKKKETETVKEEPSISREDVRQALLNAKRAGVKVKDIMSKYVPEGKDSKFDNVPSGSYAELMKEIAEHAV